MKKHKDMDWELFELLEGELTAKEESALKGTIESDTTLESEWGLMQMTQLEAPTVTYKRKQQLVKKETILIAFSAVQWRRVAAIAAILALCYPIWQVLLPSGNSVERIAGSATELITPGAVETKEAPSQIESHPKVAVATIAAPKEDEIVPKLKKRSINQKVFVKQEAQPQQVQERYEMVFIEPINTAINLQVTATALNALPMANVSYNMADLLPKDEGVKSYNGIRGTMNAGIALLVSPFRDARIKLEPTDKKTLKILYSSTQYNATAMVRLKPLK
ncbi:MAG: hypothetical protein ACI9JN_002800 [Bacteroidia bacterium]|jgi:hypothetical protein